jgi:uncharacterized membrane protein YcaP (DUF421 family)
MKPEEIKFSDWGRILIGEVPPSFFVEVVIRTIIIFLLLILSMRLFGVRMAAQVNRIEMLSLFSLAAAIGVPLQTPDRGLLPAVIIAIVVILLGRLLSMIAFGNERWEAKIEDRLSILANDGVVDMKKMNGTRLTMERLYAQLRKEGIRHLGEVKRLYLEANGTFSIVRSQNPSSGLCILPANDMEFVNEQQQCKEQVCTTCGKNKADNGKETRCTNCKNNQWEPAII